MEGQDEQTKSRVVKVDSVESWDLFVSQANNQGCPVSFIQFLFLELLLESFIVVFFFFKKELKV